MTDLRTWRKKRGYTLEELAEMLGSSIPSIHRIEVGQQYPGPALMYGIERLTGEKVTASSVLRHYLACQGMEHA